MVCAPKTEWLLVAGEPPSFSRMLGAYVAPLAGLSVLAPLVPAGLHAPSAGTLLIAALAWGLELLAVCVLAEVVNTLAPFFGGVGSRHQALKVAAYSFTPLWLVTIFVSTSILAPPLQLLASLHCTYLLYLGVGVLMQSPRQHAFGYATTTMLCAIVLGLLLTHISASVAGIALQHLKI
ncbi:MAG TPA: Yip1 family protein [Steroidobacteraceae bacterium]|nr:Yip1 family protein [Steroidobacteraceae bacterium]